jgi:hypothetical protein
MVVTAPEPQYRAFLKHDAAKGQGRRDELPARRRIQAEQRGVALMPLPDRIVSLLLGQAPAAQMRTVKL